MMGKAIIVSIFGGSVLGGAFGLLTYDFGVQRDGFACWLAATVSVWLIMSFIVFIFARDEFTQCKRCGRSGDYLVNGLCTDCWYES